MNQLSNLETCGAIGAKTGMRLVRKEREMRVAGYGVGALLCLWALTPAFAQEAASPASATGRGARDASAACSLITSYGEVQPTVAPTTPPPTAGTGGGGRGAGRGRGGAGRGSEAAAEPISIPDAPQLPYTSVPAPAPPVGTAFAGIGSVDVMPNGHLLVFQRQAANQLMEYDADGRLLRSFDDNIAARAHGLKVDRRGNIWITDGVCNTVMKLDPTGAVLMTLGTKGKAGSWDEASGAHLFNQPNDVIFGTRDDFWVVTGHGGNPDARVEHFDRDGRHIGGWSMKHADGTPATIHTMAINKSGELYISDREVHRIVVMSQDGKLLRTIQMKNRIGSLVVDKSGGLWMSAGEDGMIFKIDWDGKVLGWMGKLGPGPYEYSEAHYMAISPDMKTIYAADSLGNKIHKYVRNN
jgi:sugar lactone lactonase YvrE